MKGEYVKLDLFVQELRTFNADAMFNTTVSEFIKEYDLLKNLFYCGVKRENEISYFGAGYVSLYFPEDCGYSSENINEGDHLIVYGEIIDYSTNTWSGYNDCGIIPKYIENNGQ